MKLEVTLAKSQRENGTISISGDCVYMDTKFTFTVSKAPPSKAPKYSHIMYVHAISAKDNKILQYGSKRTQKYKESLKSQAAILEVTIQEHPPESTKHKNAVKNLKIIEAKLTTLREGKRLDDLNICREVYLRKATDSAIKEEAAIAIQKLYSDYQSDILGALKSSPSVEHISARTAYDMYQKDFFASLGASTEKVLRNRRSMLSTACSLLNHRPISALTVEDIKNAAIALDKSASKKLHLTEKFFDFCGTNRVYAGPNPISLYFTKTGIDKNKPMAKGRNYPSKASHLTPSCERALHALILQDLMDDLSLAIPLAKGFRMSIDRMLEITWGELEIKGAQIIIPENKKKLTGSTHNYGRPPLGETAEILLKKRTALREQYADKALNDQLLLPISGTTKQKKARLSRYFRNMLETVGTRHSEFEAAIDPTNSKAAGGAGYALLCKHYDHVLKHRCGIDPSSGVGLFMRSKRIYDTTTDTYRSLIDETGNEFLQVVTGSEQLFFTKEAPPPAIESTPSGEETVTHTVVAAKTPQLSHVSTQKAMFIPAGTLIILSGIHGITGTVKFSDSPAPSTTSTDYVDLY